MFDLHCHLLPGIDDGPQDLGQTLDLARMMCADGISHAVVTPHIHPGRYENRKAEIEQAVDRIQRELRIAGIRLELAAGAEVRLDPMIPLLFKQGQLPCIGRHGEQDILLLEFPHSHIPPGTEKLIDWLLLQGIRPLIAHPERNKDVIRKLDKIRPFVDMGCLLQVTAGAVAGLFGDGPRDRAQQMLEQGWVSILATDAHDTRHRIPALNAGRGAAARIVGEAEAWNLVRERPREWVAGRFKPESLAA